MNLVQDWKRITRKAWSFRLTVLAAGLAGAEMALPYLSDLFPPRLFLALSMAVTIGAAIARIVAQPEMHDDAR
jgi:hypothetical protein